MRASLLFLIFFGLCNQSLSQGAANDNANRALKKSDDLGRRIFHAIQNNQYERAKDASALILTQKDMKRIGHDLIKSIERQIHAGTYKDPADGHAMIAGIRSIFLNEKEIQKQFKKFEQEEKKFRKSFLDIHSSAKKLGFDWLKAKYLRTDNSAIKPDKHVPLSIGDLFVHFTAEKREFRIKLPNCAELSFLGWLVDSDPLTLETVKIK